MPTRQERLLEIALEAIAKLKGRVDALPEVREVERIIERVIEPQEPSEEVVKRFVDDWLDKNPPKDGQDATPEQIAQAIAAYLQANPPADGEDGKDAEPVTSEQIRAVVDSYFVDNPIPEPESIEYARIVREVLRLVVVPEPEPVDYERIVSDAVARIPVPEDGDDGQDGRGIEKAEINANGELVFTFTDGEEVNLGKVTGDDGITQTLIKAGKAGVSEQRVLELIAQNGGGGGGGEGRQEVFIGEQPAINYPAISYGLIEGTNLYRMTVNVV